jgi:hypothetical protein
MKQYRVGQEDSRQRKIKRNPTATDAEKLDIEVKGIAGIFQEKLKLMEDAASSSSKSASADSEQVDIDSI